MKGKNALVVCALKPINSSKLVELCLGFGLFWKFIGFIAQTRDPNNTKIHPFRFLWCKIDISYFGSIITCDTSFYHVKRFLFFHLMLIFDENDSIDKGFSSLTQQFVDFIFIINRLHYARFLFIFFFFKLVHQKLWSRHKINKITCNKMQQLVAMFDCVEMYVRSTGFKTRSGTHLITN